MILVKFYIIGNQLFVKQIELFYKKKMLNVKNVKKKYSLEI